MLQNSTIRPIYVSVYNLTYGNYSDVIKFYIKIKFLHKKLKK